LVDQAYDFEAESDALAALLEPLGAADWRRVTQFKGWTVDDVVAHLHLFNVAADLALSDEAAFAALWWLRRRITTPGELFKIYLLGYAVFRFAVEFVRGNEVVSFGLTRGQLVLLALLPLLIWHVLRQARRGAYQLRPVAAVAG
jgi:hypothetical protein